MSKNQNGTATKKADETKKETAVNSSKAVKEPTLNKVEDLSEIKKELEQLRQENESLKKGKLKLSFAEAEKLYKRKSELIRQLARYDELRQFFESFNLSDDPTEFLNAQNLRLSIDKRGDYDRWENAFGTSNKMILGEFIPFISEKIKWKIQELTAEVETIDI